MDEASAYLAQAASDLRVYDYLVACARDVVPECHPLHYLQMATEKLAKAATLGAGATLPDRPSHVAFAKLPQVLRTPVIGKRLGYGTFKAYCAFLDRATPLFRQIDELNPAVGVAGMTVPSRQQPNVEYPWLIPGHGWTVPSKHRFGLVDRMRSGDGAQMVAFVRRLIDRFDEVFR